MSTGEEKTEKVEKLFSSIKGRTVVCKSFSQFHDYLRISGEQIVPPISNEEL